MRQAGSQLRCEIHVHRVMYHTCVHVGKAAETGSCYLAEVVINLNKGECRMLVSLCC